MHEGILLYTNISLTTTAADTVLSFYRIFDTESMFEQLLFISTLHGTVAGLGMFKNIQVLSIYLQQKLFIKMYSPRWPLRTKRWPDPAVFV